MSRLQKEAFVYTCVTADGRTRAAIAGNVYKTLVRVSFISARRGANICRLLLAKGEFAPLPSLDDVTPGRKHISCPCTSPSARSITILVSHREQHRRSPLAFYINLFLQSSNFPLLINSLL